MKQGKKLIGIALALCTAAACVSCMPAASAEGAAQAKEQEQEQLEAGDIFLDMDWTYADHSVIHTGAAQLIFPRTDVQDRGITVCVNAGHGTQGGSGQQTLCHPDRSAKVTGGSTAEGAVYATAISSGTTFLDGTTEAEANLMVACALRDLLLEDGYRVLMIRSEEDVQLDNIARTVIANNCADCHIAIHFDSTETDKGAYYCSVPQDPTYRAMEPVASVWEKHEALGQSLMTGLGQEGAKLFEGGPIPTDLTQTSYSAIPSVDVELGDRASDHSGEACYNLARGLKAGVDLFFSIS